MDKGLYENRLANTVLWKRNGLANVNKLLLLTRSALCTHLLLTRSALCTHLLLTRSAPR